MLRRVTLVFSVGLWIAVVCFGIGWLWSYNHVAGTAATAPNNWPEKSGIARVAGRHSLVMLAHPKCPCTRASVEELSKLMTNCAGRVNAYLLFVTPKSAPSDWYKTDLWSSAARIPGVTVIVDQDGHEASRFGALTSGQVVLYDTNGTLIFSGGITSSRGHIGDNLGRSAVESLILKNGRPTSTSSVFGCPLFNASECPVENHENAGK